MVRYAILCGSATEDFRQRKLVAMHDFLVSDAGGSLSESDIVIFPNGVHELMLEAVLNNALDACADVDEPESADGTANVDEDGIDDKPTDEVLLYVCARTEADLHAELSDSCVAGVEVVRLGDEEIRKDVISYYEGLMEKLEIGFQVIFDWDGNLVSEEELGYEKRGTCNL